MGKEYSRYFLALKEDNGDYTIKGKKAIGKCVIEVNGAIGKVLFTVSNLKPDLVYKAYLIQAREGKSIGVCVGSLMPDKSGQLSGRFSWEADNVAGTGMRLSEFNGAGILFVKPSGVTAPVAGFREGDILWKNNFSEFSRETMEETAEETVTEEVVETAETVMEEVVEIEETVTEEVVETAETVTEEVVETAETVPEEVVETEEAVTEEVVEIKENVEIDKSIDIHETLKKMAEKFNRDLRELNLYGDYGRILKGKPRHEMPPEPEKSPEPVAKSRAEYDKIMEVNVKIQPFREVTGEKWVRMSFHDLETIASAKDMPEVIACFRRYRHLILGRDEKGGYCLGVPDLYYCINEKKWLALGFSSFKCCDLKPAADRKQGYWLMKLE